MILKIHRWPTTPSNAETVSAGNTHPTLVFLHGMGGTGALWRPIAAGLESEFTILAPDQRGHGGSRPVPMGIPGGPDALSQFTPMQYGRDVNETLEALVAREPALPPFVLIGHSMGVRTACATAYLKADLYPNWIAGLILVDLGLSGVAGGGLGDGLAQFLQVLPDRFANRAEAKAFMHAKCPDPSIGQYLMAVSQTDATDGALSFPFDRASLMSTIHAARDFSVRGWLETLGARGMPILFLRGAESLVWTKDQYAGERGHFSRYASVSFAEVSGAGHGLPFEKRPEFVRTILEFTKRLQRPAK